MLPCVRSLLGFPFDFPPAIARMTHFFASILLLALLLFAPPALAQISIEIGPNEAELKSRLAQSGYTQIETKKIGMSSSIFEACKGDRLYEIRFEWTGRVEQKVRGRCRSLITLDDAREKLRQSGYDRINIEDRSGRFLAIACLDRDRLRLSMNYYGDIENQNRLGTCERRLSTDDVAARLQGLGYENIEFVNRQPPVYGVEACLGPRRYDITIDDRGEILREQAIGRCRDRISADELVALLENQGYSRVQIIDARLPRYRAEACLRGRKVEVTLNRFGRITGETDRGSCRRQLTLDEVTRLLEDAGYSALRVDQRGDEFLARGCFSARVLLVSLNRYGEIRSRRDLGSCQSPRISELADTLEARGMRQLDFSVEACEGKNRVRIEFDRFGNRLGKVRIGSC